VPPGAAALAVPGPGDRVDVGAGLRALFERGVRHLLLEGGPTLAGAFAGLGYVDRVVGYLAPALLGAGPAALGPAGIATIGQARRLDLVDVAMVGPDLRVVARLCSAGRGARS
jgi:diaminohydroxyphosphoribosylaminopyrimidine deaminase/5-amino-6-(5-phosphoribosylamino)uracil reductase